MAIGYDEYGNQYDSPAGEIIMKAQHTGYYEGERERHEAVKKAWEKKHKRLLLVRKVKKILRIN